ncbi:MAG: TlpA family protein disulfide reductase [Acidobacteriota bacterium]|nr:TlpA family protein disulfide reductase [Acidobacteriota bacterium]
MSENRRTFPLPAFAAIFALLASSCFADQIPRPSPDFTVLMNGGPPIEISQYKGKAIALIFLLTTCPHCQKTVGILSKLQTEYGAKGFQVVGCAIQDMASLFVPDFVKKFQPAFPVGFSERGAVLTYLEHPVMLQLLMPQVVFIDRGFTIQAQYSGDNAIFTDDQESKLRAVIEPLLANRPEARKSVISRKKTP